ncbi:hypothetical protein DSECCO2_643210 [anaerobic digester metagenome]
MPLSAWAKVITAPGSADAMSSMMRNDPSYISSNQIFVTLVTLFTPTAKVPGCPEESVPEGAWIVEGFLTAIDPEYARSKSTSKNSSPWL